jgi:hypothetical protein
MKIESIVLAAVLSAALFSGCSTPPVEHVYQRSQFDNGLDYLRFCQRHELQTRRCE